MSDGASADSHHCRMTIGGRGLGGERVHAAHRSPKLSRAPLHEVRVAEIRVRKVPRTGDNAAAANWTVARSATVVALDLCQ